MMDEEQRVNKEDQMLDDKDIYRLRLFITGATPNSSRAVLNIKEICNTYLKDNYQLEIIDVYQQPLMAEKEQLIALPLLIKLSPFPPRKLVGDMSDRHKVLRGLNIPARTSE